MSYLPLALTTLSLALPLLLLTQSGLPWPLTSEVLQALLVLGVSIGQLARLSRYPGLGRGLLTVSLMPLGLALASYLLPEYWMGFERWQWLANGLLPGMPLDTWRPPLMATLCLTLIATSAWLGHRPNLGTPLLLGMAAMLLVVQFLMSLPMEAASHVLRYSAPAILQLSMLGLLAAQGMALFFTRRAERGDLKRPLFTSLALVLVSLLFWHQQKTLEDRALRALSEAQGAQIADRFTREVEDQLAAMRRFANAWQLVEDEPDPQQWATLAEPYHRDFRYFLNIAFIDKSSRIIHVYPPEANRMALGVRLFDVQPEGRAALSEALYFQREGRTDIIELLQGGPGIIHYLPITNASGTLGAAAMVISLKVLVDTLAAEVETRQLSLKLEQAQTPLVSLGPTTGLGMWRNEATLDIAGRTLTLVTRPSQLALLAQRSRLPVVGLTVGLTLAYLLYMVLYAYRHLALQHRTLHRSNHELRQEVVARTALQREIEWLARHDELTGLPNRRLFMETLKAQATQQPLSILICDVDHFKQVNDHLGHLVGDRYLERLARIGRDVVETAGGLFARYGGEEFVACLPRCESARAADIAEQIRSRMRQADLRHHDDRQLTVSIGLATLREGPLDIATLMQTADEALYQAKSAGRNRIIAAGQAPESAS